MSGFMHVKGTSSAHTQQTAHAERIQVAVTDYDTSTMLLLNYIMNCNKTYRQREWIRTAQ